MGHLSHNCLSPLDCIVTGKPLATCVPCVCQDLSSFAMLLLETGNDQYHHHQHQGVPADMTIDNITDAVDSRPSPGGSTAATSGAKAIKNFFRKRTKSTSRRVQTTFVLWMELHCGFGFCAVKFGHKFGSLYSDRCLCLVSVY